MSAHPIRNAADATRSEEELVLDQEAAPLPEPEFDVGAWRATIEEETPAAPAARLLLGSTLALLGLAWLGFVGWIAGQTIAQQGLAGLAQWVALASGPLALLALVWVMFGRTRRRESEAFTRSVVAMKGEARALEVQLVALTQSVAASKAELADMMAEIDRVSTDRAERLTTLASSLRDDARVITQEGGKLDATARRAREDLDIVLSGMPEAEQRAAALAERLQAVGTGAEGHLAGLLAQLEAIGSAGETAEQRVRTASEGLGERLEAIREAGDGVDRLLDASAAALSEIRTGIDTQAAAVAALLSQAQAGMQRTGSEVADALADRIQKSDIALEALQARVAEQDQSARRMLDDLERGLLQLDESFESFARQGDSRALAITELLRGVRERLNEIAGDHVAQHDAIEGLSHRTREMKSQVDGLVIEVQERLLTAFHDAEKGAGRLLAAGEAAAPFAETVRDATVAAGQNMDGLAEAIVRSGKALTTLEAQVTRNRDRVGELQQLVATADGDAKALAETTGPALVDALVRVREAAAKASERAREAIERAIPDAAGTLGTATAAALEKAFEEHVRAQVAEVDVQAARAIEASRAASDRLSAQLLSIGQTAAALEEHMTEIEEKSRDGASEDFARRVSTLMESMNSAAIDVGKILAEDVDEKSWNAYLKGERGVFTRRAVKLLSSAEAKAIGQQYDEDPEFRDGTNRYIHDFEAMLRRVLAERDGAMIAVTLMGSDMGKLYAALAQAVDRRL